MVTWHLGEVKGFSNTPLGQQYTAEREQAQQLVNGLLWQTFYGDISYDEPQNIAVWSPEHQCWLIHLTHHHDHLTHRPAAMVNALLGVCRQRDGQRYVYAKQPPFGYVVSDRPRVSHIHIDIDYPALKAKRHGKLYDLDAAELQAASREADADLLEQAGALVIHSGSGLHAVWFLACSVPIRFVRDWIVKLAPIIEGQIDRTNVGDYPDFQHYGGGTLSLPLPKDRTEAEHFRLPDAYRRYFWRADGSPRDVLTTWSELSGFVANETVRPQPDTAEPATVKVDRQAVFFQAIRRRVDDVLRQRSRVAAMPSASLQASAYGSGASSVSIPSIIGYQVACQADPAVAASSASISSAIGYQPTIEAGQFNDLLTSGVVHRFATTDDLRQWIYGQTPDEHLAANRYARAVFLWERRRFSPGEAVDHYVTDRLVNGIIDSVPTVESLRGERQSLVITGICAMLLSSHASVGNRFFYTYNAISKAFSYTGGKTHLRRDVIDAFVAPLFTTVDHGRIPGYTNQRRPVNIYEPTDIAKSLLSLMPQHRAQAPLIYESVQANAYLATGVELDDDIREYMPASLAA